MHEDVRFTNQPFLAILRVKNKLVPLAPPASSVKPCIPVARGPKNGQRVMERGLFLGFWVSKGLIKN